MKNKPILIASGIALAVGAIWYIKKSEKGTEEFYPTQAPATYLGSQEAAGSFFNPQGGGMVGGGAPSSGAPGVVTAPSEEHNKRPTQEEAPGYPGYRCRSGWIEVPNPKGGVMCVPIGKEPKDCPPGKTGVGVSAIAGRQGGIRCI